MLVPHVWSGHFSVEKCSVEGQTTNLTEVNMAAVMVPARGQSWLPVVNVPIPFHTNVFSSGILL